MAVFTFTYIMLGFVFKAIFYILYGICMAIFYIASFIFMLVRDVYRNRQARRAAGW